MKQERVKFMTNLLPRHSLFATAILLAASSQLAAQTAPNAPHAGYVFPAGGCRGTTFEVVVGGQNTKEVTDAHISGEGIQTKIVRWRRPLTAGENNALNMKISNKQEELEKKNGKGTVTRKWRSRRPASPKRSSRRWQFSPNERPTPSGSPIPRSPRNSPSRFELLRMPCSADASSAC